jgi:hypothetical protein
MMCAFAEIKKKAAVSLAKNKLEKTVGTNKPGLLAHIVTFLQLPYFPRRQNER